MAPFGGQPEKPEKDFHPQFLTEIVKVGGDETPFPPRSLLGGFLYGVCHFTVASGCPRLID